MLRPLAGLVPLLWLACSPGAAPAPQTPAAATPPAATPAGAPESRSAPPAQPPVPSPPAAPRVVADVTRDVETLLAGVRDQASAQAARARLDQLARELGDAVAKAGAAAANPTGPQGIIPEVSKLAGKLTNAIDNTTQAHTKVYQELQRIAGDAPLYRELKSPVDRLKELIPR